MNGKVSVEIHMQTVAKRSAFVSKPFGIVTPEAVVLDFETAGIGSRTAAKILDLIIQGVGLLVAFIILGTFSDHGGPSWVGVVVGLFLICGFVFVYPALFETFMHGKTPGKSALGLQVVTEEGGPILFRHAAIRSALGIVELLLSGGAIALLTVFFTRRDQRVGDILAGTLVLRQRSGAPAPTAIAFVPVPGTEDFVSTIDVTTLTAEEYQTIRSFLLRAESLQGQAREMLAVQLANQMAARLRLTPPSWMTAMQLLIGIAAAYQFRFRAN
jgi:uncharacterized RDD family membrane protein YckC